MFNNHLKRERYAFKKNFANSKAEILNGKTFKIKKAIIIYSTFRKRKDENSFSKEN
jgi:hypothetical protein